MSTLVELEDVELLELTRGSSVEAYAVLYDRYVFAARRLARHLGQREEADDVVSESFAQVLDLLNRGKGPDRAFRAYLFTTIRHESGRRAKANKRVMPTDDESAIDSVAPFGGGNLDGFETSTIRAAYESLPERWRTVLWHLDVEGRQPNELAPILGLKPNSVSALVYRARSGLREAYLQQHVKTDDRTGASACRATRKSLAGVVRRTAGSRDQEKVHAHLSACQDCMAIYLDLEEVNREIGSIGVPAAATVIAAGGGLAAAHGGGLGVVKLAAAVKGILFTAATPAAEAAIAAIVVLAAPTMVTTRAEPPKSPATSAPAVVADAPRAPVVSARAESKPASTRSKPTTSVAPSAREAASTPLVAVRRTDGVAVDVGAAKVQVGSGGVAVDTSVVAAAGAEIERVLPDAVKGATGLLALPDRD
ncbi:RNA polymerase sigma factor [Aeromicrobium sp. A1-2]|uniref:RNA polymerase sigma factor n=1 Tax=Aeromicrobium sp. A1-2 TaxID=2107713 RepID=UPI0013C2DBDE|nr:sigma-70 family RNA polymerase sigma factor [Aeromicrobium sp. A1-2]